MMLNAKVTEHAISLLFYAKARITVLKRILIPPTSEIVMWLKAMSASGITIAMATEHVSTAAARASQTVTKRILIPPLGEIVT